ncbi:hypothetical protein JKP88DRAFT_328194 [Tribonema minus]|uniref:Uncharacterized protein n=1 Tax=Tribonema minus TaxID=303371 RepID=A0A835YPK3_9STRA|nr:hypothetical protein JKP88DRAFT_328194 [Tribonema minus]
MDVLGEAEKKQAINVVLLAQAACAGCFFVCACVVARNANAGFNIVLTALLYIAHALYTAYVVGRESGLHALLANLGSGGGGGGGGAHGLVEPSSTSRLMAGGVAIGTTSALTLLSLTTAVYWGRMSGCTAGVSGVAGYSCYAAGGMRAASAFAALLLVCEALLAAALVAWKDALFAADGLDGYEGFGIERGGGGGDGSRAAAATAPPSLQQRYSFGAAGSQPLAATADL